jgi:hypothetical protein
VFHNVLPSCVQRLSTRPEEKRAFDNSDFTTEFTIDPLDPFGSSVSISTAHCGLYYRDLFVPESSGVYLNRLFWTLYYIQEPHNTYNVYNFFTFAIGNHNRVARWYVHIFSNQKYEFCFILRGLPSCAIFYKVQGFIFGTYFTNSLKHAFL